MKRIYILGLLLATALGLNAGGWLFRRTYQEQGYVDALKDVVAMQSENPREFSVDFFGRRFAGNSSDSVDAMVLVYGAYERDVLYLMRDYLLGLDKPDKVFWDVGSHIGLHSIYISNYATTVHAFDPYPPVLQRFRELVSSNSIENIKIHGVGLGARSEKLPFFVPTEKVTTVGTFDQSFGFKSGESSQELSIVHGDEYLSKEGLLPPDLIKMDIEGFEKPALEGLRKTLNQSRPVIVVEITPNSNSEVAFRSQDELLGMFPDNYSLLSLDRSLKDRYVTGQYRFKPGVGSYEDHDQIMYLIYPDEKKSLIEQLKGQGSLPSL